MLLCADVGEAGKRLWEEVYLPHTLAASPVVRRSTKVVYSPAAAHVPGVAFGPFVSRAAAWPYATSMLTRARHASHPANGAHPTHGRSASNSSLPARVRPSVQRGRQTNGKCKRKPARNGSSALA